MESFGGGWTRFGKGNMRSEWNYINEDEQEVTIEVIAEADIQKMQSLGFTQFRVISDVQFWLQQDNSYNPSWLAVTFLPGLTFGQVRLMGDSSTDHTHIQWSEGKKFIIYVSTCMLNAIDKFNYHLEPKTIKLSLFLYSFIQRHSNKDSTCLNFVKITFQTLVFDRILSNVD